MEIKNIYPIPKSYNHIYRNIRSSTKIIFFIISLICIICNLIFKGQAWSLIVVWTLLGVWRLIFSLKLVEFSVFSHIIRIIFYIIGLLLLIDFVFINGFAEIMLPIVIFISLLIMFILFYIWHDKKDRNIISILILALLSLLILPYAYNSIIEKHWLLVGFHLATIILFIMILLMNHKELRKEIKARIFNR